MADIDYKQKLERDVENSESEVEKLRDLVVEAKEEEKKESKTYTELVAAKKQTRDETEKDYNDAEKEYKEHRDNKEVKVCVDKSHQYNSIFTWEKKEFTYTFDYPLVFDAERIVLKNDVEKNGGGAWHNRDAWGKAELTYTDSELRANPQQVKDFYTDKNKSDDNQYHFKTVFKSGWWDKGTLTLKLYAETRYTYQGKLKTNEAKRVMDDAKKAWEKEDKEYKNYETKEGAINNLPIKEKDLESARKGLTEVEASLQENKTQALMLCFLFERIKGLIKDEDVKEFVKKCKAFYNIKIIDLDTLAAEHRIDGDGRLIVIGADTTTTADTLTTSEVVTTTTSATSCQGQRPSVSATGVQAVAKPPPPQFLDASRFSATDDAEFELVM